MAQTNWQKSEILVDLLGYFIQPNSVSYVGGLAKWRYELNKPVMHYIDHFVADGVLVECETVEILEYGQTADRLRSRLKEAGLKRSGTKKELAQRLANDAPGEAVALVAQDRYLKCASAVSAFLRDRLEAANHERQNLQDACRLALGHGDLANALKIAGQPARSTSERRIRAMYAGMPDSLKSLPGSQVAALRVAAAMHLLFNERRNAWLPDELPRAIAQRGLNHYLRFSEIMASIGQTGKDAQVHLLADQHRGRDCGRCRAWLNTQCPVSAVPAFPLVGCDVDEGCPIMIRELQEDAIHFGGEAESADARIDVCALCGARNDNAAGSWAGVLTNATGEAIVQSSVWPEDTTSGQLIEVVICPKCFRDRLVPWLTSQGATVRQTPIDG